MKPLGAATARAEIEQAPTVRAPLFHTLMQRMADGQRWVVLDLGPARNETIALLGQFRCRLDIADLAADLDQLDATLDVTTLQQRVQALLPQRASEAADIVLCWDLFNYLPRPVLAAVLGAVAARMRPGASGHALIAYSNRDVPDRPGRFFPVDAERLANSIGHATRPAIRHLPEDLKGCLPGLTIERGVLLANGMREYLFRF
jgi:hypothetical protein